MESLLIDESRSNGESLEAFLDARERDSRSFFCYRMPGSRETVYSLARVEPGLRDGAFVTAPFSDSSDNSDSSDYSGFQSTTREEHRRGVLAIRGALRDNGGGKCVLSRVIVSNREHTLSEDFLALLAQRPDAFVFLFRSPKAGMWIGASPELLLAADGGRYETMSLAGTRPAGTPGEWDDKNIEEQRLVTDFIADTLRSHGLQPEVGPLHTHAAGPVEHLCNRITAPIPRSFNIQHSTSNILTALSPTPALCGSPRGLALRLIAENERHRRGHYGGFLGPYRSAASFRLFVNLRSAMLLPEEYVQFVGGGITRFSDPDAEWLETERKSATLPRL